MLYSLPVVFLTLQVSVCNTTDLNRLRIPAVSAITRAKSLLVRGAGHPVVCNPAAFFPVICVPVNFRTLQVSAGTITDLTKLHNLLSNDTTVNLPTLISFVECK